MRNNPFEHLYIAYTDTFWFNIEVDFIWFEIVVLNVTYDMVKDVTKALFL